MINKNILKQRYSINDKIMTGCQLCDSLNFIANTAGVTTAIELLEYKGYKVEILKEFLQLKLWQ